MIKFRNGLLFCTHSILLHKIIHKSKLNFIRTWKFDIGRGRQVTGMRNVFYLETYIFVPVSNLTCH